MTIESAIAEAEALKSAGRPAEAAGIYESWLATHDGPSRAVAWFGIARTLVSCSVSGIGISWRVVSSNDVAGCVT